MCPRQKWRSVNRLVAWCTNRSFAAAGLALLMAMILWAGCGKPAAEKRLWREFVMDLMDIRRIADCSVPDTVLLSSYDRTGGNDDFNHFASTGEDGWVVLADLKGPGCVRRFWTTGMSAKHQFRIFIDDAKKPQILAPVAELFGKLEPFSPPLAKYSNNCYWSYVPITFDRALRIETEAPGPGMKIYFQINIDRAVLQPVQSLPSRLEEEDRSALRLVSEQWEAAVTQPELDVSSLSHVEIAAGESETIFEESGPAVLSEWTLQIVPDNPDAISGSDWESLPNDMILQVHYDGSEHPSIDAPVGSFFLNAWGRRKLGSMMLDTADEGYRCRFPMPFQRNLRILIANHANSAVRVAIGGKMEAAWSEELGYLHAEWNRSGPARGSPHHAAFFQGAGKFVGCFLGVTGWDPSFWVLEGDEAMYVNGGTKPVWHGTGLEDYFNGGWYYRTAAFSPLHGVLDRSHFRTAQYRFHLVDAPTFQRSFRLVFERGHGNESQGIFQSTAFAYLTQPGAVRPCPSEREKLRAPPDPLDRPNCMLKLIELERMNNFRSAMDYIAAYLERNPEAPEAGVLMLRAIEYGRLMGDSRIDAAYQPFIDGVHGPEAASQAKLLKWFYEKPERALVGVWTSGDSQVFLDGNQILVGGDVRGPAVVGVEIKEGHHVLAAVLKPGPNPQWMQLGIRTHLGVAGTGPGSVCTARPGDGWTSHDVDTSAWFKYANTGIHEGPPVLPHIEGVPNAFVLLSSKVYALAPRGGAGSGSNAYFRAEFRSPLIGWPEFSSILTGLPN
jgi:hypothetical protein